MDIMTAFSSETIVSFWELFFLPMVCTGCTWLLFRVFWKPKLDDAQKWISKLYKGGDEPGESSSVTKVLVIFGGLLFIYTYGKLFSIVGAMIPGSVEVNQSGLLIRMNTMKSNSDKLPKLWAYYDSIDNIDRLAKLIIHNVSVLAAQMSTSYFAMQYVAMREEVLSLTAICAQIRVLMVAALLFWTFASWDLIGQCIGRFRNQCAIIKRTAGITWILIKRVCLLALVFSVLLCCLSFFSCNLMEALCKQAQNRCDYLLTFLEADGKVPSKAKLEHARDMVLQVKDLMRAEPIGIEQDEMTGIMWRLCTPIHDLYPNLQRILDAPPLGESTPVDENTPEDEPVPAVAQDDVRTSWGMDL